MKQAADLEGQGRDGSWRDKTAQRKYKCWRARVSLVARTHSSAKGVAIPIVDIAPLKGKQIEIIYLTCSPTTEVLYSRPIVSDGNATNSRLAARDFRISFRCPAIFGETDNRERFANTRFNTTSFLHS